MALRLFCAWLLSNIMILPNTEKGLSITTPPQNSELSREVMVGTNGDEDALLLLLLLPLIK